MAGLITIRDDNHLDYMEPPPGYSKGLNPRDFRAVPYGSIESIPPFSLDILSDSDQASIFEARKKAKANLSDIRNKGKNGSPIPSRDQNGKGYCWMHSGVSAAMVIRAKMHLPYADLSAYAGACIIKDYRDEGGNGIQGVKFLAERGIPDSEFWPQQSMDSGNDNPKTWENAKLHRMDQWTDLDPSQMKAMLATSLLLGYPVVSDFNWWSHSVCALDVVSLNPFSILIWNSWGDSWSQNGMGVLSGSKAIPDNAVACIGFSASQN